MNKNIEVINENLWVVNFNHIRSGWIKELTDLKICASDYMGITQNGKIILNKAKDVNAYVGKYLSIIMGLRDNEISKDKGFQKFLRAVKQMNLYIKEDSFYSLRNLYFNLVNVEKQRRKVGEKNARD